MAVFGRRKSRGHLVKRYIRGRVVGGVRGGYQVRRGGRGSVAVHVSGNYTDSYGDTY